MDSENALVHAAQQLAEDKTECQMIQIVIGTSHIWQVLGNTEATGLGQLLVEALIPLLGSPIVTAATTDDLDTITVYDALHVFHQKLTEQLKIHAEQLLSTQKTEILELANNLYHLPAFDMTEEDVLNYFAVHDLFSHGRVAQKSNQIPVYLPDYSNGARLLGCLTIPVHRWMERLRQEHPDMAAGGLEHLARWKTQSVLHTLDEAIYPRATYFDKLECHLCDSLRTVYNRATAFSEWLWSVSEPRARFVNMPEPGAEVALVIDALRQVFFWLRSLRRDEVDVPSIARHRVFSAAATRQGIAKPVVSRLFPIEVWEQFDSPVRHFLLDAAERAGAATCRTVYPDTPSREEVEGLSPQTIQALFGGDDQSDIERIIAPLRQLGLEGAFLRQLERGEEVREWEREKWISHWNGAITECKDALYESDIESSLYLRSVLELYPLHKHVLGLVEYIIVPLLIRRGLGKKPASGLWTDAFMGWRDVASGHPGLSFASLTAQTGILATLETEGDWLLHAADHESAAATRPD